MLLALNAVTTRFYCAFLREKGFQMSAATLTARSEDHVPTSEAVRGPVADERAASVLGWFSVALGAAEVFAPHAVARLVGLETQPQLMRLFGAREIASGVGILTHSRPTKWLWARVAGDIMDLAVLGAGPVRRERGAREKLAAATAAVVGVTLLDTTLAMRYTAKSMRKSSSGKLRTPQDQLVHFLSDMYSVEQQALAQLISAPKIAGDPQLAEDFRRHYIETEEQADLVRERLEANGGSSSAIKNAVMKLGGKGFLLFARAMPETPGRLVNHAYSYEAMEWAGYEMLRRFAERAGDRQTIEAAKTIGPQERAMMDRLERGFDAAEQVSHAGVSRENLGDHLRKHLAEVHAFGTQDIQLLAKGEDIAGDPALKTIYRDHLEATRKHVELVEQRLEALGTGTSKIKDSALALGGVNWGLFFQAQSDTPAKFAAFMYAVLHLELGGYELLKRTARRIDDSETAHLCEQIVVEKRKMADRLAGAFDDAVDATLDALSL